MNSNWSYNPEMPNLGQNQRFFLAVWAWNLMDDLEKQQGTSLKDHQDLCIISLPYVNLTRRVDGTPTTEVTPVTIW